MTRSPKVRVLLALGAAVSVSVPVALASAGLPKVPTFTGPNSKHDLQVRPASILYAADGSGFWAGPRRSGHKYDPLSWTSWTSSSANGSGFDWVNDCRPDCASGTFHSYPIKLALSRPRTEGKHLVFTRLTLTYAGTKPSSHPRDWKVSHHGRQYTWTFTNH